MYIYNVINITYMQWLFDRVLCNIDVNYLKMFIFCNKKVIFY